MVDDYLVPTPSEVETSLALKTALANETRQFFAPSKIQVATTAHALLELVSELLSRGKYPEAAIRMAMEKLATDADFHAEITLHPKQ